MLLFFYSITSPITLTISNAIDFNFLKQASHISANEPDKSVQAQPQAQVFYANVGGNIQQVAANSVIMNGNKSIKLLMNMPSAGSFNPSDQVQVASGSQPTDENGCKPNEEQAQAGKEMSKMPNMNGDNTLLKALLQTAPKNATAPVNSTTAGMLGLESSTVRDGKSWFDHDLINPFVID